MGMRWTRNIEKANLEGSETVLALTNDENTMAVLAEKTGLKKEQSQLK